MNNEMLQQEAVAPEAHWRGRAGPVFAGNLAFEDVSFSAPGKQILSGISFSLEAGRIACLLGPSGCGKSTLLKLAAGVLRPRGGRILLDGQEVAGPRHFVPPEKRSVGLMFQDFALFPHMTALENVAFGLTALDRGEARRVATLALERVGLLPLRDSYPVMLSGGEQQRVALARTIVPRPQVILMDEPFSSLDQRLREVIRDDTLSILKETRATALLVTHDPQEAIEFADWIYLMRHGAIVQGGTPEDVQRHPVDADAARFFRSYNEFSGSVGRGKVNTPAGPVGAPDLLEGARVLVMVPPEDIKLAVSEGDGEAQVTESRFVGPNTHLRLQLADSDEIIAVTTPAESAPRAGQFCNLAIEARNTHIFTR
jgi:iron(III) transport system ATP-binding protein